MITPCYSCSSIDKPVGPHDKSDQAHNQYDITHTTTSISYSQTEALSNLFLADNLRDNTYAYVQQ